MGSSRLEHVMGMVGVYRRKRAVGLLRLVVEGGGLRDGSQRRARNGGGIRLVTLAFAFS